MRFDLAAMTKRGRNHRKREIVLRPIVAPSVMASDLIAQAYAPVLNAWAKAIPEIMAEYERTLAAMVRDSAADLSRTIGTVEQDNARLFITVRLRLLDWASRVEAWQRGKWRDAVKAATGLDIASLMGPRDMAGVIEAAVERNVSLVRSVSDQARQRISEAVMGGLQRNAPADAVARDIRAAVDMGRRRARLIASDQLSKLGAQLNVDRRQQAGIDTWEWVSSHALNYRPEHLARDGKRYSDAAPPRSLPGEEINCKCTSRAVLSLEGDW